MKRKAAHRASKQNAPVRFDRLAEMVQAGFLETRENFVSLEDRLGARIGGVEQKIDALRSEMISMHFDYKTVKPRLENVELKLFGST